jgi:hypothetical protein
MASSRRVRAAWVAIALAMATFAAIGAGAAPAPSADRTRAFRIAVDDTTTHVDANAIDMIVTNRGSFAYDRKSGLGGLVWPKGGGKSPLFAAGPWLGALVNGDTLVAVSDYSDDYGPGSIVAGTFDDPARAEYHVYRLYRRYGSATSRDSALASYVAGAVPHGAPHVTVLSDGSLDILGDEMAWAVYNDADPARHVNIGGRTAPLGLEVQQTTFQYHRGGPLDQAVFLLFRFAATGPDSLHALRFSPWTDPDLGAASDDLVGCDTTRDLGYVYNATDNDAVYAPTQVALGLDLVRGPIDSASGDTLGMTAFTKYIGGDDPQAGSESYRLLSGLHRDGSPFVNPITGLPTQFFAPGDPVTATGFRDTIPSDRRFMVDTGPFEMATGDTQRVLAAIVIATGTTHLDAITQLKAADDYVQALGSALLEPSIVVSAAPGFAQYFPGDVHVAWQLTGATAYPVEIQRRIDGGAWAHLADVASDAGGEVDLNDSDVDADRTYDYRLAVVRNGAIVTFGDASIAVPRGTLVSGGFRPNPAPRLGGIAFSLESREPARLDVIDLAGRKVLSRDVTSFGPGNHILPLDGALKPGVYLVRVTQAGRSKTGRGVVLD